MEIFILLGLILLNGVFAMSEIALVTARKARLLKLAGEGDAAAAVALKLGEDPTRFLSTVQIGITSISILNGIVGEAAFAGPLAYWLLGFDLSPQTAHVGATALVVIVVTYISIVVGELVPKRIGQLNPELIARLVARPMQVLALLTRPFVLLLSVSTHALLGLLGAKQGAEGGITEEEIHALINEGSEAGVIDELEHAMVRNVFRLDSRMLGSLMVPRTDVVYLDTTLPPAENLRRLAEAEHSRFPVCAGGLENILGVIHTRQVLAYTMNGQTPDFTANLQPTVFVPETLTGLDLLEQFRANHNMQIAFIIDEYGEIEGIITVRDLLKALTGEFQARNAEDAWAVRREDGSWLLDGAIPVPEMKDCLQLKSVPEENKGRYYTVSGMLLLLLGRMPQTGDHADWGGWRFEIVDMDQNRIDKVLVSPAPRNSGGAE